MKLIDLNLNNIYGYREYSQFVFDPYLTTITGKGGIGKTASVRGFVTTLYGGGKRLPTELDDSWKLDTSALRKIVDENKRTSTELNFIHDQKRYKILKYWDNHCTQITDDSTKPLLIVDDKRIITKSEYDKQLEYADIKPAAINAILTNEQYLIGSIAEKDISQEEIEKSFNEKIKIARNNLYVAQNVLNEEIGSETLKLSENKEAIERFFKKWKENGIFKDNDEINNKNIDDKLENYNIEIGKLKYRLTNYEPLIQKLSASIENINGIRDIINVCKEKENLDLDIYGIKNLKEMSEKYTKLLEEVRGYGDFGILQMINKKKDELDILRKSKILKNRQQSPEKVVCDLYPPEGEDLGFILKIPDQANKWGAKALEKSQIAQEYSEDKENYINKEIIRLKSLDTDFKDNKKKLDEEKECLIKEIFKKKGEINSKLEQLKSFYSILNEDNNDYIQNLTDIVKSEDRKKYLEFVKRGIEKTLRNMGSDEVILEKFRADTVKFVNEQCEKYGWNFKVIYKEHKIVPIDKDTNEYLDWSSGSQGTIIGLAFRWQIASHFKLPLFLDEIDSKINDPRIKQEVKKLLEEDRSIQKIILTSNPEFIMGKIYEIKEDENGLRYPKLLLDTIDDEIEDNFEKMSKPQKTITDAW